MAEVQRRDLVIYHLLWFTYLFVNVYTCEYPDFVQSHKYGYTKEWYGHIPTTNSSVDKYEIIVQFKKDTMMSEIAGPLDSVDRPLPYIRECLVEPILGKYLVKHRYKNTAKTSYLCIEFLKRSNSVIQLRTSAMSVHQRPALCSEDQLNLDEWPLVEQEHMYLTQQPCPLQGGFSMKIYDTFLNKGVCDAYHGDTRLESECMAGEGMYFRFRNHRCVPKGMHMQVNQQTFCMASWTDKTDTFIVLRHKKVKRLWCLRYPTNHKKTFVAHLFTDLVCVRSYRPPENIKFLTLNMYRDPPQPLCIDDYEACDYWGSPCSKENLRQRLTCARQCGVCNDGRPSPCRIGPKFRGEWRQNSGNGDISVDIDDVSLQVGDFDKLKCIQWEPQMYDGDIITMDQMFVTEYENGCRARFTCVRFRKHAPSVLRYKISESHIWPFPDVDGETVDCTNFNYKEDYTPFMESYRSRHYKVLTSATEKVYVDCRLIIPKYFDATFSDGSQCAGTLTQQGLSKRNKLKLLLETCAGRQTEQEFACLDSQKHSAVSNHIIITETLDTENRILCWIFPVYPQHKFYMVPVSHCYDGAVKDILAGNLSPLASFTEQREATPKSFIFVESILKTKLDDDAGVVEKEVAYAVNDSETFIVTQHHDSVTTQSALEKDHNLQSPRPVQNTKTNGRTGDNINTESKNGGWRITHDMVFIPLVLYIVFT